MAKRTETFEMKLDAKDAIKEVEKLDGDMTALADTIGIEVSGSISAMEDKLYELALQGKQNTDQFKQLQKQTAQYKQIVIETDRSIDALAEQGRGLSTALALAESTVAGYQAFVGVSALLGDENEELLETITKLEAAQGVLNSIMVVKEQLQFNAIKLTQAQTAAQGILNKVLGEGSKATKILRGALAGLGIGALIAAIGYLVANFDKLRNAITGVSESTRIMNGVTDTALDNAAEELSAADKLSKTLADETLTRNQKVEAVKELQDQYPSLLSNVDAEKDGLDAVNRALELNTQLLVLKAKQEAIAELRVEQFKKQIQEQADAQTGANVGILDYLGSLTTSIDAQEVANAKSANAVAEANKQIDALDGLDKELQKQIESLKNQGAVYDDNTDKAKETQKEQKKIVDQARLIQDLTLELEGDTLETALERNRLFYQRKIEDTLADETILQEQKNELIELYTRQSEEKRMELFDQYGTQELELRKAPILQVGETAEQMEIKRTMTTRIETDKRIKMSQEEKDAMVANFNEYANTVSGGLESLNNLNDLVTTIQLERAEGNEAKQEQIQKKSFERNKKIQIGLATIQGIQGVINALTASSILPEPFASIQKGINATVVATATAANIAKIKASKFGGGASPSLGGGGGVQGATSSQFSIGDDTGSAQTFLNPDGSQQGGTSQPTKVYVTETDISNVQQNVNQIDVRSTF